MRTNFGRTPENSQKLTTAKQMLNEEREHLKTLWNSYLPLPYPLPSLQWSDGLQSHSQCRTWSLLQQQNRPPSQVIAFSWSKVSGSFQRTDAKHSPLFCLTQNSQKVGKQKTVTKNIIRWGYLGSPGAKITAETHRELPKAGRESWWEFL